MAKKNAKNQERRALVEKMRQEQARKERNRSLAILGVCVLIVIGLLAAAIIPYLQDKADKAEIARKGLDEIGVSATAASCDKIVTKSADGSGDHKEVGTPIEYGDAPPAFGPHWGNFMQGAEIRNFYTPEDRPELERMVHSLEHGHTFLWYDSTIKEGSKEYEDLQNIATKFEGEDDGPWFNVVPWKKTDGADFPEGKHVALTHWTGPKDQEGVWQFCAKPSGEAVADFGEKYDKNNAPEPGAP